MIAQQINTLASYGNMLALIELLEENYPNQIQKMSPYKLLVNCPESTIQLSAHPETKNLIIRAKTPNSDPKILRAIARKYDLWLATHPDETTAFTTLLNLEETPDEKIIDAIEKMRLAVSGR